MLTSFIQKLRLERPQWIWFPVVVALFYSLLDHRVVWDWIYTHWLYDYHFGFMKRGLIGEGLSLILGRPEVVSIDVVKWIAWTLFGLNFVLLTVFFREVGQKATGVTAKVNFLLFAAFFFLAPVSIRNFSYDLGRFDQFGFLFLFLQWFSPTTGFVMLGTIVSILIHENFIFILLPAILLLHYLQRGLRPALWVGAAAVITTLSVVKFGKTGTDIDTLWTYLVSKANSPLDHNVELLYWTPLDQLRVNWDIFLSHVPYLPGYVLYALYCWPAFQLFKKARLDSRGKQFAILILLGYVGIMILSDWCRSIANFYIVLSFLCLYFMREESFRREILESAFFRGRRIFIALALSLVLPAAGVDLPRIYKLIEIAAKKVQSL